MRFFFIILISLLACTASAQQRQIADLIVAMVNDHVILKSDVDRQLAEIMQQNQSQQFDERMWYYLLESIIDNHVLVEKAKIDSLIVSDAEVDRILTQRINQLVAQVGSEQNLEREFGQSIIEIKAEYADRFREDMLVNRVRQSMMDRINITRPEVKEYFESIPADSLPVIPESVSLSQITVVPPPKPDARENARRLASELRDSILHHNATMEDLARRYSDGPTAARGGEIPMLPTAELLPEYAAAAAALDPGGVSEVVGTSQGFHIIRLNERRGQNISTHHILISVSDEELDEQHTIDKLTAIQDSIMNYGKSFAEMARLHSEDRNTAPAGGRLADPQTGERHIPVTELSSSLVEILSTLNDIGDISPPVTYQFGENNKIAYRIVRLNERIPEHIANLEQDYKLIRHFALQQKRQNILSKQIKNLRDIMYVEYRIPMPDYDPAEVPQQLMPGASEETGQEGLNQ